jgi:nitrite reductase/ring-hydroxylating ferredoxin subunit
MKTCPIPVNPTSSPRALDHPTHLAAARAEGASPGWVAIARDRDLLGPGPFAASIGGVDLVLVRTPEGLRAFDGRCPHQGALLAEGDLAGGELVCRNHGWRFDASTGARRAGPGCLRAHAVEVRDGQVLVRAVAARPVQASGGVRTIDDLPGPRGVPLLGNTLGLDLERLHVVLERWLERYGPVFRVDLGRPASSSRASPSTSSARCGSAPRSSAGWATSSRCCSWRPMWIRCSGTSPSGAAGSACSCSRARRRSRPRISWIPAPSVRSAGSSTPPGAAHEPGAHIPFGSGPRLCPGRSLALLEMRVALAMVFGSFSVERVGDRDAVEERFAFTMGPRRLRLRLTRRPARATSGGGR